MDEPNEQAQAAAPETPVATEQPQPEVVIAKVETPTQEPSKALSPTERYLQRKQQPKQEAPKTEAVAQPEVTIETEAPAETVDEAGNPETVDKEQTKPKEDKILPNRINTSQFNQTEQEAIALLRELRKDDEKATLKDAYVIVEQRQAEAKASAPKQESEPAEDPVAAIEAELSELRAKRREYAKEGKLYEEELDEVNVQIEDKIRILSKAEAKRDIAQERAAEAESAKVTTAFEKSKAEAIKVYPDLSDTTSDLGKEVSAFISELQTKGNPNASLLEAADAPMVVAQIAATRLAAKMESQQGIPFNDALQSLLAKPEVKKQAPAAAQPPKGQAKPKIQPASGATQASPPPPKQNPPGWDRMSPTQKLQHRYKERGSNRGVGIMV